MKKQINQKFPAFIYTILLSVSVFISINSCQKSISGYPRKPVGPSNPINNPPAHTSSKIIYTDVSPDSMILDAATDSFNLDLNNDGIIDFAFTRKSFTRICSDDLLGLYGTYTSLSVVPGGSNAIITNGTFPLALDSSAAIDSDSLWATTSQILVFGATGGSGRCALSASGYWFNVSDKYLGLKLIKNNNTYYGWARLSSSFTIKPPNVGVINVGHMILKDYAFNSIPDQQILAGQKK